MSTSVDPEAREAMERLLWASIVHLSEYEEVRYEERTRPRNSHLERSLHNLFSAIIAAGWQHVPPTAVVVQTEGPKWEAGWCAGRDAAVAYIERQNYALARDPLADRIRALTPKQETRDGR